MHLVYSGADAFEQNVKNTAWSHAERKNVFIDRSNFMLDVLSLNVVLHLHMCPPRANDMKQDGHTISL